MKSIVSGLTGLAAFAACFLGGNTWADTALPTDSPALAIAGPHRAGFRSATLPGVFDPTTGGPSRSLPLAIWYPTKTKQGSLACYKTPMQSAGGAIPAGLPSTLGDCGSAIAGGVPVAGTNFPVVVLSHGLRGWATGWSILAENLASKGYVVIATDHQDRDTIDEGGINRSFGEAVLRRPFDQRAVLKALHDKSSDLPNWVNTIAKGDQVVIIGYSMGAYGAITTAGAGITQGGPLANIMPAPAIAPLLSRNIGFEQGHPLNLRGLVLMAPFGGGLPLRAWTPEALNAIKVDTLVISGDQDDVVNYAGGVRWIFENMTGAPRSLLTYQNARHNIAMNPTPSQVRHLFMYRERFDEPVWRSDRLQAINAHMVTAFLSKTLRKDSAAAANYLTMPVARAVDGQWPLAPGASAGADTATLAKQPAHWPGFQRRWAIGLEFESLSATK
jgi:alpha-beta hydrolase superfamily lysophospholipase